MSSDERPRISRRAWITTTSGVIAAGLVKTQTDAIKLVAQEVPSDPTRVPGRLVSELGTRAPAEQPKRLVRAQVLSSSSRTPLADLMGTIKSRLKPNGILSGYTIIEPEHGGKHLHQHEYEFHDKADLARFLEPWFKNVQVLQTDHPGRQNLYFWASDAALPMERDLVLRTISTD